MRLNAFWFSHCSITFLVKVNSVFYHCIITSTLFVVFLEKKVDDKLRQYSLEGETYLPGVVGVRVISLLKQTEGLWSHDLRTKYGLLGTVKKRESKSILFASFFCKLFDCMVGTLLTRKISLDF